MSTQPEPVALIMDPFYMANTPVRGQAFPMPAAPIPAAFPPAAFPPAAFPMPIIRSAPAAFTADGPALRAALPPLEVEQAEETDREPSNTHKLISLKSNPPPHVKDIAKAIAKLPTKKLPNKDIWMPSRSDIKSVPGIEKYIRTGKATSRGYLRTGLTADSEASCELLRYSNEALGWTEELRQYLIGPTKKESHPDHILAPHLVTAKGGHVKQRKDSTVCQPITADGKKSYSKAIDRTTLLTADEISPFAKCVIIDNVVQGVKNAQDLGGTRVGKNMAGSIEIGRELAGQNVRMHKAQEKLRLAYARETKQYQRDIQVLKTDVYNVQSEAQSLRSELEQHNIRPCTPQTILHARQPLKRKRRTQSPECVEESPFALDADVSSARPITSRLWRKDGSAKGKRVQKEEDQDTE